MEIIRSVPGAEETTGSDCLGASWATLPQMFYFAWPRGLSNVLEKAVFTIAVGGLVYLRMACALARSYKLWNRDGDVPFYLATDASKSALPRDLQNLDLIPLNPGQYGKGFSPKLH